MNGTSASGLAKSFKRYSESVKILRQSCIEGNVQRVNFDSKLCLSNLLDTFLLCPFNSSGNYVFGLFYILSKEAADLMNLSGKKFESYHRKVVERLETARILREEGIAAYLERVDF